MTLEGDVSRSLRPGPRLTTLPPRPHFPLPFTHLGHDLDRVSTESRDPSLDWETRTQFCLLLPQSRAGVLVDKGE